MHRQLSVARVSSIVTVPDAASGRSAGRGPGVVSVAAAAVAARLGTRMLRHHPPGGTARWTRTNHAGREISLLEGPGFVLGALVGVRAGSGRQTGAASAAALLAVTGAGAVGLLDDLAGDSASKGLRGHLGALRSGRVTTGVVKIAGLAATGAATAYVLDGAGSRVRRCTPGVSVHGLFTTLAGGAVIAGCANLANLLDLRPGRALKVVVLAAAPLALTGHRSASAALGAALGSLPDDLAGATMLGDTGANAAGALVGTALVARLGPAGRLLVLTGLAGLILASERVSFTRVIESTPVLRELDAWGRP